MGVGSLGLYLALWQGGLAAARWALGAENSTGNWSAGLVPPTPSPIVWSTDSTISMATDGGTQSEPRSCEGDQDCPPWSRCEGDQAGRASCHCGLGYHLSPTLGCVPARTFPGRLQLHDLEALGWSLLTPPTASQQLRRAARLESLFQQILGPLEGFWGSSVQDLKWPSVEVTMVQDFSARVPVTAQQVEEAVAAFRAQCRSRRRSGTPACTLLHHIGTYQSLSLCHFSVCNSISTSCAFRDGLLQCACRPGYIQAHSTDRTCVACDSGFWLQNGSCTRCPFGFRGASCQEPFLLALVIVSCLAGLLLLLLLLCAGLSFSGRGQPHTPPQLLPMYSPTLSLPRVRPPWTVEETGESPTLPSLCDTDLGQSPRMKTFLRSPSSPSSAPQPMGGCSNLVFIRGGTNGDKRSFF